MANFQHLKASRTRVLDTFPTKNFGNDGDIVISRISGRGVFICTKAGGMWYVANRMEELRKHDKVSMSKLQTNSLSINKLINAESKTDKILVLGLTYKKDINDLRESPSLKIFKKFI